MSERQPAPEVMHPGLQCSHCPLVFAAIIALLGLLLRHSQAHFHASVPKGSACSHLAPTAAACASDGILFRAPWSALVTPLTTTAMRHLVVLESSSAAPK